MEANGVDVMASGDVRFIFRSDETDVNVTIEGKREWVERIVDELGLSDVGSFIPLGQNPLAQNQPDAQDDDDDVLSPPLDMGPEPDPSRIPVVRRPIGELNVEVEIEKIGLEPPSRNDVFELMDAFSELDEPRPIQGQMSVDPMAEAWLRELMRLIVREGARTALATETIEEVASAKLGGRTGLELSVWLESLFAAGFMVGMQPVGGHLLGGSDKIDSGHENAHLLYIKRSVASKGL